MRVTGFVPGFVCVLAAGSLFAAAAPQILAQGIGTSTFGAGSMEGMSKQPYSATWTEKQVQTLANGTTVTHESTTKFARDSSGRSYTETHNTLPTGSDGQPREMVNYHIFDTVARTTTSWNSTTKEATVTQRPDPATMQARPTQTTATRIAPTIQTEQPVRRQNPDVQREDLGTKNIVGVNAKGIRITRVIPAAREGNDQPITTIQETWSSREYAIVLMSTNDDPRSGTTTREVTEFTPGEPDAALFRLPEGYTVREVTPRTVANQ
ncbi:hypothetical protein [Terracidiphilus gabretensis]|jgi:hypothetical protein|uniref:hypothetical protein n=1 Tax=Terracidiphilus gabretensis TaxID=1577687 RepID=UPI00071B8146|nr:hypothetical protein [Terracidiphilus gabretensis]